MNQMPSKREYFYVCNGRVPYCGKDRCHLGGGPCKHTRDLLYAKYPEPRIFRELISGKYVEVVRDDG